VKTRLITLKFSRYRNQISDDARARSLLPRYYFTGSCGATLCLSYARQVCARDVTAVPLYTRHTRQVKPYKNVTRNIMKPPCAKFSVLVKVTRMGRLRAINHNRTIKIFIAVLNFSTYIIIQKSFLRISEEKLGKRCAFKTFNSILHYYD